MILAEERTTEEEKKYILKGPYNAIYFDIMNIYFRKVEKICEASCIPKHARIHIYIKCKYVLRVHSHFFRHNQIQFFNFFLLAMHWMLYF